jgi:Flp pilus assembly protein CpaB
MKNQNKLSTYKKSVRTIAAASALAIAASGVGASQASANSRISKKQAIANVQESHPNHRKTPRGSVRVAERNIQVPGSIKNAKAKPIVFNSEGHTYLAYTQNQKPDFNQKSPADVAGDMTIIKEPAIDLGMPLQEASLDKSGIFVGENDMAVGYSIGGNKDK